MTTVFITGGTGYIGRRLIKTLLSEGLYNIKALVRPGSLKKLPPGCEIVEGDALNVQTYIEKLGSASVFVHLVGVPHPSPSKKSLFRTIDLRSVREAKLAATQNNIAHFVYVSVSQYQSNVMKEYQAVRAEGEELLSSSGITCSFIRPWYVLGPGHWWPLMLLPFYWIARLIPAWREKAEQQGLVTIHKMLETLVFAIKNPPDGKLAVYNVPDIRNISSLDVDLSPVH